MSSFPYAKTWTKSQAEVTTQERAATALLVLANIKAGSRLWGYSRFVLGTWPLRHCQGLRFAKQLGSGKDGGFGLRPSLSIQGLFLAFDETEQALAFWHANALIRAYQENASECFGLIANPIRARGSWSGRRPFEGRLQTPKQAPDSGAFGASARVAALTRASIRLRHAGAFWAKAPAAQASLANHPGCLLAVGLGEAPLLRQATFSVWESAAAMDQYARTGAHLAAIRAAGSGGFFAEDMFVRFKPLASFGSWQGKALNLEA